MISIIRNATESDLENILKIESESFSPDIQESRQAFFERMQAFSDGFFVLECCGTLAGYFCSELWNSVPEKGDRCFSLNHSAVQNHVNDGFVLYISSIAVSRKFRGSGMGKKLFCESLQRICKAFPRITDILLVVSKEWQNAVRIYKENGFSDYDTIPSFFPGNPIGTDGIIMRKKIRK